MGMLSGIGRAKTAPPATDNQLETLQNLVDQTGYDEEIEWDTLTVPEASDLISELLDVAAGMDERQSWRHA